MPVQGRTARWPLNRASSVLSARGEMSNSSLVLTCGCRNGSPKKKATSKMKGSITSSSHRPVFPSSASSRPPSYRKIRSRALIRRSKHGRSCDISSACHWTINMAAAAGHGRLWAGAYSMLPCGIMVPPDSKIKTSRRSRQCADHRRLSVRKPLHDDSGAGADSETRTKSSCTLAA